MEKFYELKDIVLIPNVKNNGYPGPKADFTVIDQLDRTGPIARSLPIFTSPTDAIVGCRTVESYLQNGIKPIVPLTEKIEDRLSYCQGVFCSFTLDEIENNFLRARVDSQFQFRICIDEVNGHQQRLFDTASRLKKFYGAQVILMAGQVARPEAYSEYARAGIDYMRVGLASGSLDDPDKFGFHYPTASLLEAIKTFKKSGGIGLPRQVKIIVDGGISSPSDIIKAMALGADYVIVGADFARCLEAEGQIYKRSKNPKSGKFDSDPIDPKTVEGIPGYKAYSDGLTRQYHGCTSPEIRARVSGFRSVEEWKAVMGNKPKASWTWVPIDSTIPEWVEEFKICANHAFMMMGVTNWEDFKKNVSYGIYEK